MDGTYIAVDPDVVGDIVVPGGVNWKVYSFDPF